MSIDARLKGFMIFSWQSGQRGREFSPLLYRTKKGGEM
jgi:hypothetical protein